MFYVLLLFCDFFVIWFGFVMGVIVCGKLWMLLYGVLFVWYFILLYIVIGLGVGVFLCGVVEFWFDLI